MKWRIVWNRDKARESERRRDPMCCDKVSSRWTCCDNGANVLRGWAEKCLDITNINLASFHPLIVKQNWRVTVAFSQMDYEVCTESMQLLFSFVKVSWGYLLAIVALEPASNVLWITIADISDNHCWFTTKYVLGSNEGNMVLVMEFLWKCNEFRSMARSCGKCSYFGSMLLSSVPKNER